MTRGFAGPADVHAEAVQVVGQQVLQAQRHAHAGQAEDERARKIEEVAEGVAEERVHVGAGRAVGKRRAVREVGQARCVGRAAGQEFDLRDEQRGDQHRADQVDGHDRGGGDHQLARVADAAGGVSDSSSAPPLTRGTTFMIISKPLSPSAICGNDHKDDLQPGPQPGVVDGSAASPTGWPRDEHYVQPGLPNLGVLSDVGERAQRSLAPTERGSNDTAVAVTIRIRRVIPRLSTCQRANEMIDRPSVIATRGSASRSQQVLQRRPEVMVVAQHKRRPAGEQSLAVRVMDQMDRGVGERQAARDDEIGGGETEQRQHDELAAPAGVESSSRPVAPRPSVARPTTYQ